MSQDALMAGGDTTGNAAAFLLYNMARHPEVQDNLFKEITQVLGEDKNKQLDAASLAQMNYLKVWDKLVS